MDSHRRRELGCISVTLEQLILNAQDGDREAMRELIEQHQDKLYRFCVYLAGQPALAQDLTQDAFIQALEKLRTLKEPKRFQSWLFTLAKNIYLDHLRRADNAPYTAIEDAEGILVGETGDCDQVLQIQAVLAHLEPEDRTLLLMVDLEGMSYSEAATAMGMKEASVASRLHRIRELFMRNYKE